MDLKERFAKLKEIHSVMKSEGNYSYSPHLFSMFIGMELALSILEERMPTYPSPPENWGEETAGEVQ